ncbi:MAG: hypothetical protein V4804_07825 [Pseudomonadota bacterium]
MTMYSLPRTGIMLLVAISLSGCIERTGPYVQSPNTVIATGLDKGRDKGILENGRAAIAYDPDGCQNWLIDDGLEGYSSPRHDPVTGLPICNNQFPPGTVLKNYQTNTTGMTDRVSGPGRSTVVRGN